MSRRHSHRPCLERLESRRLLSFGAAVNHAAGGSYPSAIATADFNGDGKLDLANTVGVSNAKVIVRMGNGAGGFGAAQEFALSGAGFFLSTIGAVHLNSDSNPDLVVSDGYNGFDTLIGNGDGTFQPAVQSFGTGMAYVGNPYPGSDTVIGVGTWLDGDWWTHFQVWHGDGQGGLAPAGQDAYYSGGGGGGVAPIDLNNDGLIDLVTGEGLVFMGNNWGLSFDWNQTPSLAGGAVASGDFNGDGKPDAVVAGDTVAVLRGRGDGSFDPPVHHSANGPHAAVATADLNADGKLDAIVSNSNAATVTVMLGNGDGTLRFAGAFATGTSSSAIAVGDVNHDGRPDVAVANRDSANISVLLNDGDWSTLPPTPATLSVSGTTVTEGDSGTSNATFLVTLAAPAAVDVTVQYSTQNISATQLEDYVFTSGTLTIPAGQTSRTITVPIRGDLIPEATETFSVNLGNATGAPITAVQAIGTIIDNDPGIVVSNVSRAEKHSGTTPFNFTVSLTRPSTQEVRVNYATASGTATSSGGNRDYQSKSGTLIFAPGVTTQTVTVSVIGDTRSEPSETFFVNLSQPVNAPIADAQGQGLILDDDSGAGWNWVGPAAGGSWSTASNWSAGTAPDYFSLVLISGATVTLDSGAQVRELAMDGGATLRLAASGGDHTLRTTSLFLEGNAALDLGDNGLIVDYDSADVSAVAALQSLLLSGRNGGGWNGSGIRSSTAASTPGTGVSYFHATELWTSLPAIFPGHAIDSSSFLMRYTLLGDANVDGTVDLADFSIVAGNFSQTGRTFAGGNFDYDPAGDVGLGDFAQLAANFNRTLAPPDTAASATPATPATRGPASIDRRAPGSRWQDLWPLDPVPVDGFIGN